MEACILIVDDELDIVNMLADFFSGKGYRILTASSGEKAIRQAERKPDLILLDIQMPGMDGLTVCKRIRDYISCPILFLTAVLKMLTKSKALQLAGMTIL